MEWINLQSELRRRRTVACCRFCCCVVASVADYYYNICGVRYLFIFDFCYFFVVVLFRFISLRKAASKLRHSHNCKITATARACFHRFDRGSCCFFRGCVLGGVSGGPSPWHAPRPPLSWPATAPPRFHGTAIHTALQFDFATRSAVSLLLRRGNSAQLHYKRLLIRPPQLVVVVGGVLSVYYPLYRLSPQSAH